MHNTGLVAAYGFEEASGTDGRRTSSTASTARSPARRASTDGRFGRALSFDGTDDWVTVADRAEFDLLNGGTLEAWVRPSALGTGAR